MFFKIRKIIVVVEGIMKKRFLAIYLAIFLILLSSCGENQKATVIGMKSIKGSIAFLECVNSISLRPLETDDVHLMGSNVNLIVTAIVR